MPEYIEREAALKCICSDCFEGNMEENGFCGISCDDYKRISKIPAADVRPVVRGRWIRHYEQADTGEDIITYPCGWVCSECGRWESEDEPFCNCGAKMEES